MSRSGWLGFGVGHCSQNNEPPVASHDSASPSRSGEAEK